MIEPMDTTQIYHLKRMLTHCQCIDGSSPCYHCALVQECKALYAKSRTGNTYWPFTSQAAKNLYAQTGRAS